MNIIKGGKKKQKKTKTKKNNNKVYRISRKKSTARKQHKNIFSESLILKKEIGGRPKYQPTDFFDPDLDFALERDIYTNFRNDATLEEINRIRVYSLLNNLNRRINNYSDNVRINVWNELVENINRSLNDGNNDEIREIANQYNNARYIARQDN
jgi:hypothetical protein